MDYTSLFANTLTSQGFDLHAVYNCFDPPYRPDTGWPLKLPNIKFKHNTLLLLHFQDFITSCQGRILELEQVERHYPPMKRPLPWCGRAIACRRWPFGFSFALRHHSSSGKLDCRGL